MSRHDAASQLRIALVLLLAALVVPIAPATGHQAPTEPIGPTGAELPARVTGPAGPVLDAPRQNAEDVTFTLDGVASAFAPERYKADDRFNTRNPSDVENQTTNWDNALGHRISFFVTIDAPEGLTCDDRFVAEAYIETLSGRLYGWTDGTFKTDVPTGPGDVCPEGLPGVHEYNVTFDLDGAPPTIQPEAQYPALGPGLYTATLKLYEHQDPSASNPTGQGFLAGTFDMPFQLVEPSLSLDQPFQRFPEKALRLFADVGGLPDFPDQFRMTSRPLNTSQETTLNILFTAGPVGAQFERVDHIATRRGVDLQTPTDPPQVIPPLTGANDKLQNTDDRATVQVQRIVPNLSNDTVPPSRQVLMQIRGADFATAQTTPLSEPYVPLHVVTIHLPASLDTPIPTTGAASFVAAVSDRNFPVRGFLVDAGVGGLTGTTEITLRDANEATGGATGTNAGDLFALADRGFGHEVLTRSRLTRDTNTEWVRGSIQHRAFEDPVPSYTILAMLYGPSDEFLGMTTLQRGIDIQVGALRTVEGRSDELPLTVTNLATDFDDTPGEAEFSVTVRITSNSNFPDGSAYNATANDIPEGGSVVLQVPVSATNPGDFNIVFTATSGELTDEADSTVQVITKERAREEGRKWYEIPAPSALLVVVALAGLVSLLRRRS